MFERYQVFSEREMHRRYEVGIKPYVLSVGVEANLTMEMATTIVLPAAVRYRTELAASAAALRAAGVETDTSTLGTVSALLGALRADLAELGAALSEDHYDDALTAATYVRDAVIPAMASVRAAADALGTLVADDLWTLPTYQQMRYIL